MPEEKPIDRLISELREDAEFHRTAARNAQSEDVRALMEQRAVQEAQFAAALADGQEEAVPADDGIEAIRRGLLTIKAGMTIERDHTDEILLEESREQAAELLELYQEVLNSGTLTASQERQARRQYEQLQAAQVYETVRTDKIKRPDILALFDRPEQVQRAINVLADAGIKRDHIGLLTQPAAVDQLVGKDQEDKRKMAGESARAGALGGSAVGGTIGLIAGTSMLVFSGVGTLLAPLGIAAAGAGIGASYGGLFGALLGWGIGEEQIREVVRGMEEGQILLLVDSDLKPEQLQGVAAQLGEIGGQRITFRE